MPSSNLQTLPDGKFQIGDKVRINHSARQIELRTESGVVASVARSGKVFVTLPKQVHMDRFRAIICSKESVPPAERTYLLDPDELTKT